MKVSVEKKARNKCYLATKLRATEELSDEKWRTINERRPLNLRVQ